jgi:hypothetical protein
LSRIKFTLSYTPCTGFPTKALSTINSVIIGTEKGPRPLQIWPNENPIYARLCSAVIMRWNSTDTVESNSMWIMHTNNFFHEQWNRRCNHETLKLLKIIKTIMIVNEVVFSNIFASMNVTYIAFNVWRGSLLRCV